MTIESALYSYLSNKASVTALVSDRIYPQVAPQGTAYPFVTFNVLSEDTQHDMSGASGLTNVAMQIDAWCETVADRVSVSEALRNALDGFRGAMGTESLHISNFFMTDRQNFVEGDTEGKAHPLYRSSMDFSIWHAESVPTL